MGLLAWVSWPVATMLWLGKWLLALCAAGALAALSALFALQSRLLYLPTVPGVITNRVPAENEFAEDRSPEQLGLAYEDIYLTARDGERLHGWLIRAPRGASSSRSSSSRSSNGRSSGMSNDGASSSKGTSITKPGGQLVALFLHWHGNAGNIGHRLMLAKGLADAGFDCMLVEYRGYGLSGGSPSEEAFVRDAVDVVSWALRRDDVQRERLFVLGASLGGAVAIGLAHRLEAEGRTGDIRGLVLENTFTSIPSLVEDMLDAQARARGLRLGSELRRGLVRALVRLDWNSAARIQRLGHGLPTLFLSADDDEIIPRQHMVALEAKCSSQAKLFLRFKGASHNETWSAKGYFSGIRAWVDAL